MEASKILVTDKANALDVLVFIEQGLNEGKNVTVFEDYDRETSTFFEATTLNLWYSPAMIVDCIFSILRFIRIRHDRKQITLEIENCIDTKYIKILKRRK